MHIICDKYNNYAVRNLHYYTNWYLCYSFMANKLIDDDTY